MFRQTTAYVDLGALKYNVRESRALIGPNVLLMAMVKADGYGHGIVQTAHAAIEAGANWLGVAIAEEGMMLRDSGITVPILIVGPLCSPSEAVRYDLHQTVCSPQDIQNLEEEAVRQGKNVRAHIKVDTGMNRIGIKGEELLRDTLRSFANCPHVIAEGIFSHLSVADSDEEFTRLQAQRFEQACKIAQEMGFHLLRHLANSAGAVKYPEIRYDMVRLGIILYGYSPMKDCKMKLRPVLTWKAGITYIKEIAPGETVSYDRVFLAEKNMRVATIAVGYGDGYKRALSNKASVLINGKRAKVLGKVCMDQLMVDVTDIPDAASGQEAVLLGEWGKESVWADELAELSGTISYEIMLSITGRVPKVYL